MLACKPWVGFRVRGHQVLCTDPAVFIWHQSSRASLADFFSLLSSVSTLMSWIWDTHKVRGQNWVNRTKQNQSGPSRTETSTFSLILVPNVSFPLKSLNVKTEKELKSELQFSYKTLHCWRKAWWRGWLHWSIQHNTARFNTRVSFLHIIFNLCINLTELVLWVQWKFHSSSCFRRLFRETDLLLVPLII